MYKYFDDDKKVLPTCIFISQFRSQILDEYPKNQDFYEGGLVGFYKEAHDFLVKSNAKECDKNEIYQPRIIITKEKVVKIIQDSDPENISKNKCAYDLSMELLKNLEKWKSAEVKGLQFGAITEFIIYPKDLLSNYREGYIAENLVTFTQYPGGSKAFKKDFHDEFMSLFTDYHINGIINLEFYVDKEGRIANPRIFPEIRNQKFNKDFLRTLSRLKKIWKPSLYSNIPIKQKIVYPMNFSTTFYEK
ncbi:energy transducer TonB [Chryseobacterium terrae]|uniref:TonB protein C-terminal n=1 Tax=Chryseobacterium terrae TaxID=3163299 RepID=A0ABW8Y288_9FLAO